MSKSSIRVHLMFRQHKPNFGYQDQDLYSMTFDTEPPATIRFCGIDFEYDRQNTFGERVYVAGDKSPTTIQLKRKVGRWEAGAVLWAREHRVTSKNNHFILMDGTKVAASYATELLP